MNDSNNYVISLLIWKCQNGSKCHFINKRQCKEIRAKSWKLESRPSHGLSYGKWKISVWLLWVLNPIEWVGHSHERTSCSSRSKLVKWQCCVFKPRSPFLKGTWQCCRKKIPLVLYMCGWQKASGAKPSAKGAQI